jgi:hypothetical protein
MCLFDYIYSNCNANGSLMKKILFYIFILSLAANSSGLCCAVEIQSKNLSQPNNSDCQIEHEMCKLAADVFMVILNKCEKKVLFQKVIYSNLPVSAIDHPPKTVF